MKRAILTATTLRPTCAAATHRLFKADHLRAIDRHIDYFGGVAPWARPQDARGVARLRDLTHATDGGRRREPLAS